jgi:hypothetical protein
VGSGRVFCRENGAQLHPAHVTARFLDLLAAADLPRITLHGLRHGAASLMLAAGVDMKVVQETLGHSMLSLTADTYTSVYPTVAAAAAEAAAALIPRRAVAGTQVITSSSHAPVADPQQAQNRWSSGGAGGARTHDLTDYESAALTS